MIHIKPNSEKCFFVLMILSSFFGSPLLVDSASGIQYSMNGPYIKKIEFELIKEGTPQVLGLLDDEIDMTYGAIKVNLVEALSEAENVAISHTLRNGYGVLYINCNKYPINITSFRRALAFAMDKEAISDDVWHGLSYPQDSVVPSVNPWSIEGQLPYTYYESNVDIGISLLDEAGFIDVDDDGFREAPDGSSFQVKIECAHNSDVATQVGDYVKDALTALGINAVSVATDFYDYLGRLDFHGDYDMAFVGLNFNSFDVDWLGYEFLSQNAEVSYMNCANFKNATVDYWARKLIHARTYDEVREAATELQKLLIFECPWIVCYHNIFLNGYRTDRFEDFIDIQSNNWWTYFNVKLKEALGGPFGGTIRCGIWGTFSLNLMLANTAMEWEILGELYDSLFKSDPNLNDLNWLCESYTIQTHEDNPSVPNGHTRITYEIVQNATWTDGIPLTGEDVAFTLNYLRDVEGDLASTDLADLVAAYTPTPYQVVVEYSTESIWHLHSCAYKPIIPKHFFEDIGVDNWNTWFPNPPHEPMVTSGPFNISEYIPGEFIELTRYDNYFRGLDYNSQTSVTQPQNFDRITLGLSISAISCIVIIITGDYTLRKKDIL